MPPKVCILSLALFLGACAQPQNNTWESPQDRSVPSVSDLSECRADARCQAHLRHPDQAIRERDGVRYISDPDRFPVENRFFEQCIARKGFQRMPV